MSATTYVPGATFTDVFSSVEIPYKSQCLGLHLLGGDAPTSVANLINPGLPLTLVGGGPATFEADCAICTNTLGLQSQNSVAWNNVSTVLVAQEPTLPPVLAAPQTPQPPQPGQLASSHYLMTRNGASQFFGWLGGTPTFRPSNGNTGTDAVGQIKYPSGYAYTPIDWEPDYYYPGPVIVRPPRFRLIGLTSGASIASIYLGDEQGILQGNNTAQPTATIVNSVTKFGAHGSNANMQLRIAAIAEFTALTDAQMYAVLSYLRSLMAFRGIRC